EQPARALQPAADLQEDGAQGIAGVHSGVEHLCRGPALAGSPVIGDEQSPDRLLRRGAERRGAIGIAYRAPETAEVLVIPQRLGAVGIEPTPQRVLCARTLRVLARCHR